MPSVSIELRAGRDQALTGYTQWILWLSLTLSGGILGGRDQGQWGPGMQAEELRTPCHCGE